MEKGRERERMDVGREGDGEVGKERKGGDRDLGGRTREARRRWRQGKGRGIGERRGENERKKS